MPNSDAIGDSYRFFVDRERTSEPRSATRRDGNAAHLAKQPTAVSGLAALSEDEYRRHMSHQSGAQSAGPP